MLAQSPATLAIDLQRAGIAAGHASHRSGRRSGRACSRGRERHGHADAAAAAARQLCAELARDLGRRTSGRRLAAVLGWCAERAAGGAPSGRRCGGAGYAMGGEGRHLCRTLRRHWRRVLRSLDRRARHRSSKALADGDHARGSGRNGDLCRSAGSRCARSSVADDRAGRGLANRLRDQLWLNCNRRRMRLDRWPAGIAHQFAATRRKV